MISIIFWLLPRVLGKSLNLISLFVYFLFIFLFFLFNFTRLLLAGVAEDVLQGRHACPNCHRTYKLRRLVFRHLRKGCDLATTETMANYHGYKTPLPAFRCNFCPFITFIREFKKKHNQEEHGNDCQPSLKRAWIACSCIRLFKKKKASMWNPADEILDLFDFCFRSWMIWNFFSSFFLFEFGSKSHGCPLLFFLKCSDYVGDEVDGQSRVGCPNCQRTYKSNRFLYRHLRQGCGEIASGYREDLPCHLPVYRCHVCPYITFIKGFLHRHSQTAH